jgi:hypothetical protein
MKERHALSKALDQLDSRGTPDFGPERVELEDDVLVQRLGEHLEPGPAAETVPNLVIVIVVPDDDALLPRVFRDRVSTTRSTCTT